METQMTIRLPQEFSRKIEQRAKSLRLKRSDIVRLALKEFLEGPDEAGNSPYSQVQHLIGSVRTGVSDLGARHREHLIKKLKKHG